MEEKVEVKAEVALPATNVPKLTGQLNETKSERSARMRSIYIVHVGMLIFSLGFSIVLTGVYPYMKQLLPNFGSESESNEDPILQIYGWVVAINPLGQMIFSPILGYLANRLNGSIRVICLFCSAAYIIGNVIYSILSVFPEGQRYWVLMVTRFIIGVSSASSAPMRSYVAAATYPNERTTQLAMLSSFQSLGFVIGPGIQAALTPLKCSSDSIEQDTWISFDMYTSSGWVSAILGIVAFVIFLPGIFREFNVAENMKTANAELDDSDEASVLQRPDVLVVIVSIFNFFIYLINFVILETLGTPLVMDQFGWNESEAILYLGIAMSAAGIVSVIVFGLVGPLSRRFDERKLLIIVGIIPMIVARVIMFPMPWSDFPRVANTTLLSTYYGQGDNDAATTSDWSYLRILPHMFNDREIVDCVTTETEHCPYDWCLTIPRMTEVQFFIGFFIAFASYPFCIALCQSLFSKALGPRPQGLWMGALTAAGSLARVLGPIFVTVVYQEVGTYATFGIITGSMVVAFVITILAYPRLVPYESRFLKNSSLSDSDVESIKDTSVHDEKVDTPL